MLGSIVLAACIIRGSVALVGRTAPESNKPSNFGENLENLSRRDAFRVGAGSVFGCLATSSWLAQPALAFENKISTKYDDRPKRRGSKVRYFV